MRFPIPILPIIAGIGTDTNTITGIGPPLISIINTVLYVCNICNYDYWMHVCILLCTRYIYTINNHNGYHNRDM